MIWLSRIIGGPPGRRFPHASSPKTRTPVGAPHRRADWTISHRPRPGGPPCTCTVLHGLPDASRGVVARAVRDRCDVFRGRAPV